MEDWNLMMEEENRSTSGASDGNSVLSADGNANRSNAVYIKSIPMNFDKFGLQSLFCKYGTIVDCFVAVGKTQTCQTLKFGRVVYRSEREAEVAIQAMNNALPLRLKVSYWKNKGEKATQKKYPSPNCTVASDQRDKSNTANHRTRQSTSSLSEYESKSGSEDGQTTPRQMSGKSREVEVDADFVRSILASQAEPRGNRVLLHKGNASVASKGFENPHGLTIPCSVCQVATFIGCTSCWKPYCSRECQKADWQTHKKICTGMITNQADWSEPEPKTSITSSPMPNESQWMPFNVSGSRMKEEIKAKKQQPEKQTWEKLQPPAQAAQGIIKSIRLNWLETAMPPNKRVKVKVTHVYNPNAFYILRDNKKDLRQIMEVMQEVENVPTLELQGCERGMFIAAQYNDGKDRLWYRARLKKKLSNSKCEIFYMDFGNSQVVENPKFKPIPEVLKNVHQQAICCMLDGFRKSAYPEAVVDKFQEYTTGYLWASNVGYDRLKVIIKLESVDSPGICINEVLNNCNEVPTSAKLAKENVPYVKSDLAATCGRDSPVSSKSDETKTFTLSNSPARILKEGESVQLTVLQATNPEDIFFMITDQLVIVQLMQLDDDINKYCCQMTDRPKFGQNPGDLCLAKYSGSECWHRGSMALFGPEESTIFFVDYGNTESVRNFNVLPMEERFMELPLQAIQCQLNDCMAGRKWSESILSPLMSAADCFLVKVVKYDEQHGKHKIEIPSLTEKLQDLNILRRDC